MKPLTSLLVVLPLTTSLAPAQVQVRTYTGATPDQRFGWAVCVVGDVDGDGAADLAVGAPGRHEGTDAGRVTIFSGRTGLSIREWSGNAGDYYGHAIAPVGDLDGDGRADVLVGAPQTLLPVFFYAQGQITSGPGYAQVVSGASGAVIHTIAGATFRQGLGANLCAGGDIDGDGTTELLIGGPGHDFDGIVLVISGATGSTLRTHTSSYGHRGFGHAVTFLGDLDGDGTDDYAIGDVGHYAGDGAVRAYSGSSGSELWTVLGPSGWNSETGFSLGRLGDRDGDGKADLLVGARGDNVYPTNGQVLVLSGATGATLFYDTTGATSPDGYGFSVAAVGDLDGDGREDFGASQPGPDPDFANVNYPVRVFASEPLELAFEIPPPAEGSSHGMWGIGLGSGDANGDGLRDIVIGQPYSERVIVYSAVRSVTRYCETTANSQGCSPHIEGTGTPSASSSQPFLISAAGVINNKFGLLLYGRAPRQVPLPSGWGCVKFLMKRTASRSSGGNPPPDDCSGVYQDDFNQRIQSGVDPALVPGVQVFAQYWSRDPQRAAGTVLTDGLGFYVHP